MRQAFRTRLTRQTRFSASVWRRRMVFWCGAVAVGFAAVIFSIGSDYANQLFQGMLEYSPYLPFLVTPLGLALIVFITGRFFPGSQGSGIPQSIAAIALSSHDERKKVLSLRIASGKIILTLSALLVGASVGREGPTVQIGSAIMYSLSRFASFSWLVLPLMASSFIAYAVSRRICPKPLYKTMAEGFIARIKEQSDCNPRIEQHHQNETK
ncbi:MAG TPA: hypothetical protein DER40_12155 [Geobacter sp.]|nr:hypothetical protein [Geobacter sp.]HCE68236.1 hypothetical protein [Geobacter sp.]